MFPPLMQGLYAIWGTAAYLARFGRFVTKDDSNLAVSRKQALGEINEN